jgi:hypothetical protein
MKNNYSFKRWMGKLCLILGVILYSTTVIAQENLLSLQPARTVSPFDEIVLASKSRGSIEVFDSQGRLYASGIIDGTFSFEAGGALGKHEVVLKDRKGKVLDRTFFELDAQTKVDDGAEMTELFQIFRNGMLSENRRGYGQVTWKGQVYRYYVPWDLDNNSVLNGIQYFLPYGAEFTDLLRETQRDDGMIWSFVRQNSDDGADAAYYNTAYSSMGFFREDGDVFFARQPVDNHSDYNYVNQFYKHWKASGDIEWMKKTIESAIKALDYCYTDSIRWSNRFQLLKRPYCIDSWDFQVDDEYTPYSPISPTMVIVPGKTKYGVFFGDNTGYYEACNQVAEMLEHLGDKDRANQYRSRGQMILQNLLKVSWNGKFFTHFIDEDPTVVRNLGVDEKSQIAQSNMYSINRGLPLEINRAIIETYQNLHDNLPQGSPGEWYAIYPPFGKGFEGHGSQWQYMNGGVAGHAIGELARGAYESGHEDYATDILYRTLDLSKRHGNRLYFSYTGMIPTPPPAPAYTTVDISSRANMDTWDKGGPGAYTWMNEKREGNDLRGMPVGNIVLAEIPFQVSDPDKNKRRAAVAVSRAHGLPASVEIPVNQKAGALYLLHSVSGVGSSQVGGAITITYDDGTTYSRYMMNNKDVAGWWFTGLKGDKSGLAWSGPNPVSTRVGVTWVAIDNPHTAKTIKSIRLEAAAEGGIYAVLGVTLADRPHYVEPSAVSFGGPDNWTSGNGMGALVEGLAGVKNLGLAFDRVSLTPRWPVTKSDSASVVIRFASSNGYMAYDYAHDKQARVIRYKITGSGDQAQGRFLLPEGVGIVKQVRVNNSAVEHKIEKGPGVYSYVLLDLDLSGVHDIELLYSL